MPTPSCTNPAVLGAIGVTFLLAGLASACGDDTSGSGGAGGESAVTTNAGNGTGTAAGEGTLCVDGEEIACKCADESQGTETCSQNAFSPCHNAHGDCSH